jgi:negative regulator of genetic competence, sporulation and motility
MEIIMELILISNTKLKIMLDESDMKKYHIENECDCAEGSTRRAIRNLLECAKDQIGFNTDGEEIFVQLYASKQGGCELFVTKCNGESKEENEPAAEEILRDTKRKRSDSLPDASKETREKISLPEKITSRLPQAKSRDRARIAYSFSEMSHLLEVCKILRSSGIFPESRAFSDDTGKYYLLLLGEGLKAYSRLDRLTFIVEYGRRENPDCLVSYIAEHGRVICEMKAIETLSAF